ENTTVSGTQRNSISTNTNHQTNYPGLNGTMIKNITLRNNDVSQAVLMGQGYGQAISLIADGFTVSGNNVHDNVMEGIDIWLGSKHGEVVGNTVYGNQSTGIYVDGASDIRIYDNTVYGNPKGIC